MNDRRAEDQNCQNLMSEGERQRRLLEQCHDPEPRLQRHRGA